MRDSPSRLLDAPVIAGQLSPSQWAKLAWREESTCAPLVGAALNAKKCRKTISILLSRLQAGTASTDSSAGSTASQKACKYFVSPVIEQRLNKKTPQDASTNEPKKEQLVKPLQDRLRNLLNEDRLKAAAHAIELRSQELGEDHFIFAVEAQTLASMDTDTIRKFFEDVIRIKDETDVAYFMATKRLVGDEE